MRPGSLWTSVDVVGQTGSTNADVAAAAASGAAQGLVVVAESQTAGRGRLDRAWLSPPQAGLTFSVLLRPAAPRQLWGWLPLLAGLSVARAIAGVGEVETALKWPNDVLVGAQRRKIAGVLAEVSGDAVVLGIGVNVSTRRDELPRAGDGQPGALQPGATSLAIEGAVCTDRTPVLVAILRTLAEAYAGWLGGDDVREAYLMRCETVGQSVRVDYPDGRTLTGNAVDVDDAGRLVVLGPGEIRIPVAAGDVIHLRAYG